MAPTMLTRATVGTTTAASSAATTLASTTTAPARPLEIPKPKTQRPHGTRPRRTRPSDVHSPDALPAAVSALLSMTDIQRPPRPPKTCSRRRSGGIRSSSSVPTTTPASSLGSPEIEKDVAPLGPLEFLLLPPNVDDDDGATSGCESGAGSWSAMSASASASVDSMSSLCDTSSSCTDSASSIDAASVADSTRSCQLRPLRQERELVVQATDDPLTGAPRDDAKDNDTEQAAAQDSDEILKRAEDYLARTIRPFKSAFRSNLTASLRALKRAAREISTLKMTSFPPEDLLIQAFRPMDPQVPYTDERRPPTLTETPPPALRRYLNPTIDARIEARVRSKSPSTPVRTIAMQTFKVQRPRSSSLTPPPASMRRRDHLPPTPPPAASQLQPAPLPPAMRPREPRENPDFIRVAVLEMAMRRAGKLDEHSTGRARWALPPRKCSNKPYPIASTGVPPRWIPVFYDA